MKVTLRDTNGSAYIMTEDVSGTFLTGPGLLTRFEVATHGEIAVGKPFDCTCTDGRFVHTWPIATVEVSE